MTLNTLSYFVLSSYQNPSPCVYLTGWVSDKIHVHNTTYSFFRGYELSVDGYFKVSRNTGVFLSDDLQCVTRKLGFKYLLSCLEVFVVPSSPIHVRNMLLVCRMVMISAVPNCEGAFPNCVSISQTYPQYCIFTVTIFSLVLYLFVKYIWTLFLSIVVVRLLFFYSLCGV